MKNIFRLFFITITLLINTFTLCAQWVKTNSPYQGQVNSLAVSDTNLFAGTQGGVFLSTDNGVRWTAVNKGLKNIYVVYLAAYEKNLLVETNDGDLYLSTNNGASWTVVNKDFSYYGGQIPLAVSGTNIFAGAAEILTASVPSAGGVVLSTDNGISWTQTGLKNTQVGNLTASGTYLLANTHVTYVDSLYLFLSTNNGTSWTAVNTSLPYTGVFDAYSLSVSGTNLFAGTQSGVFLSTDNGTNWTAVNQGLSNTKISSLAVSGPNIFAGTSSEFIYFGRRFSFDQQWYKLDFCQYGFNIL